MIAVSLTQQQYQQFIDSISGLEARVATLQTHAEAQQEQIRVAERLIQQLRTTGANPPHPTRTFLPRQVTEGGAFKALSKYTGNHSESHDWSFSARRVLTRADERFAGLLQWISGQIDEVNVNDVLEYRRTTDLSSTNMDWHNSELYTLLAMKTSDTAMSSIMSLEEVEVKGTIGWQRLEREARGYNRHRVALLTESEKRPIPCQPFFRCLPHPTPSLDSSVLKLLVRYAAWTLTTCHVGSDSMTAHERIQSR